MPILKVLLAGFALLGAVAVLVSVALDRLDRAEAECEAASTEHYAGEREQSKSKAAAV